ncbi:MAG: hypothetical protein OXE77_00105 [Flavobacteriaceae bacterium]|nr:hypothetical protein [Flavobacteriaceae bacterium]MCY4267004.1 hypothetical protein [Flavobacteriaceae bacterium]
MKKNLTPNISLKADGYETKTFALTQSFDGNFLWNLLLGEIPGMIIDLATGAVNKFDQTTFSFDLEKEEN